VATGTDRSVGWGVARIYSGMRYFTVGPPPEGQTRVAGQASRSNKFAILWAAGQRYIFRPRVVPKKARVNSLLGLPLGILRYCPTRCPLVISKALVRTAQLTTKIVHTVGKHEIAPQENRFHSQISKVSKHIRLKHRTYPCSVPTHL
jgi:hypothetical protein